MSRRKLLIARRSCRVPVAPAAATLRVGIAPSRASSHHEARPHDARDRSPGCRYESARVALVAERPADYAAAVLQLHRNQTLWTEISLNGARYARSGGGGSGVCPSGLREDWRSFWRRMDGTVCAGTFS